MTNELLKPEIKKIMATLYAKVNLDEESKRHVDNAIVDVFIAGFSAGIVISEHKLNKDVVDESSAV